MEAVQINLHRNLVERCLEGERHAQNELYKLYSKAMYNICYRISNDEDDAKDILQDAFVSAFRNLHNYRGTASFGAWLKRIVVNKAINFIKKRRLEVIPIENISGGDEIELSHSDDPAYDENLILNIDKIKKAIQELPDGYRIVFSLYLMEGYDHKEIGEILGVAESTSKTQYLRAKIKLKEILKKGGVK